MKQLHKTTENVPETQLIPQMWDWLKDEKIMLQKENGDMEKLPALNPELVQGTTISVEVDASKPFGEYVDNETKTKKAKIPVTYNNERRLFWLNKKNPLYHQILDRLEQGQTRFSIITSGSKKQTRYDIKEGIIE